MADVSGWRWDLGRETVCDLASVQGRFESVHELVVSPDGERVAAPALKSPEVFAVWASDGEWLVHPTQRPTVCAPLLPPLPGASAFLRGELFR